MREICAQIHICSSCCFLWDMVYSYLMIDCTNELLHLQSIIGYISHLCLRVKLPLMWLHRLCTPAAKIYWKFVSCWGLSHTVLSRCWNGISSFVLEGQTFPWRCFQCFKTFLCPAGSSLVCLTNIHGYPTVMSSMVGIFKAWRYNVLMAVINAQNITIWMSLEIHIGKMRPRGKNC